MAHACGHSTVDVRIAVNAQIERTAGFEMRGVDDITLSDYWADGRRLLHGMLAHNFPYMAVISAASTL